MSFTDNSQMEVLETLSVLCDRFSHSIRTHLGVSMGVVDDLIAGHEITDGEFRDAKRSLESILTTLESVRDLSTRPVFEPQPCSLKRFLENGSNSSFGLEARGTVFLNITADRQLPIDERLFTRALRCILNYGYMRQSRAGNTLEVELRCSSTGEVQGRVGLIIDLSFPRIPLNPIFRRLNQGEMDELVRSDHSAHSLGLLFADRVMRLHNGIPRYEWGAEEQLRFSISFPEYEI